MAKEILAIPEESLNEVIIVIRTGLNYVKFTEYKDDISDETIEQLKHWCDKMEIE